MYQPKSRLKAKQGNRGRTRKRLTLVYNLFIFIMLLDFENGDGLDRTRAELDIWLPPRDSNPDMLIQSQLSCH
jgi:hypothetical protein